MGDARAFGAPAQSGTMKRVEGLHARVGNLCRSRQAAPMHDPDPTPPAIAAGILVDRTRCVVRALRFGRSRPMARPLRARPCARCGRPAARCNYGVQKQRGRRQLIRNRFNYLRPHYVRGNGSPAPFNRRPRSRPSTARRRRPRGPASSRREDAGRTRRRPAFVLRGAQAGGDGGVILPRLRRPHPTMRLAQPRVDQAIEWHTSSGCTRGRQGSTAGRDRTVRVGASRALALR